MDGVPWSEWIHPGDVVVDVGANTGTYTAMFAHAVGPEGRVVAFEPDQGIADRCRETCNGSAAWVDVRTVAVGQTSGTTLFFRSHPHQRSTCHRENATPDASELTVPMVALDEAMDGWPVVGIKVDAQGDDGWVLRGARQLLDRMPARGWVLMEIWPYGMRHARFDLAELAPMFQGWTLVAYGKSFHPTSETLDGLVARISGWTDGRHTNVLLRKG